MLSYIDLFIVSNNLNTLSYGPLTPIDLPTIPGLSDHESVVLLAKFSEQLPKTQPIFLSNYTATNWTPPLVIFPPPYSLLRSTCYTKVHRNYARCSPPHHHFKTTKLPNYLRASQSIQAFGMDLLSWSFPVTQDCCWQSSFQFCHYKARPTDTYVMQHLGVLCSKWLTKVNSG